MLWCHTKIGSETGGETGPLKLPLVFLLYFDTAVAQESQESLWAKGTDSRSYTNRALVKNLGGEHSTLRRCTWSTANVCCRTGTKASFSQHGKKPRKDQNLNKLTCAAT